VKLIEGIAKVRAKEVAAREKVKASPGSYFVR
jgi:hypothetical protein